MAGWACPAWRQAGFNPCSGAGQGPLSSQDQLSQFRTIQVIHNLLCPKQLPPTPPASVCVGSSGPQSWPPLLGDPSRVLPSAFPGSPRPLRPCCGVPHCTGPSFPGITWQPCSGPSYAQESLHSHAPEDPQVPCHSCFCSWIFPSPLSFMAPLSRTPYIPWPPMAVFHVSVLFTGPLLSQILPEHLDYHLPLLSGKSGPLVHGPYLGLPKAPTVPCSWDSTITGTCWTYWPSRSHSGTQMVPYRVMCALGSFHPPCNPPQPPALHAPRNPRQPPSPVRSPSPSTVVLLVPPFPIPAPSLPSGPGEGRIRPAGPCPAQPLLPSSSPHFI